MVARQDPTRAASPYPAHRTQWRGEGSRCPWPGCLGRRTIHWPAPLAEAQGPGTWRCSSTPLHGGYVWPQDHRGLGPLFATAPSPLRVVRWGGAAAYLRGQAVSWRRP